MTIGAWLILLAVMIVLPVGIVAVVHFTSKKRFRR